MTRRARRRHSRRRLWVPALVLCALAATTTPASADRRAVQLVECQEVPTLEEAARFLRVDPRELQALALRDEVPVRGVGYGLCIGWPAAAQKSLPVALDNCPTRAYVVFS